MTSTGWGIVDTEDNRISYIADGFIPTDPKLAMTTRLDIIYRELCRVIEQYKPQEAAIEQIFLNTNPQSTIKLGMARGVVILAPATYAIPLEEYEPNKVKKALVGVGKAQKNQVETMVKILLPGCKPKNNDSSDALAIAITHAHLRKSRGY